ncbi:unnamed protein product, partial [Mesorhabditis spiculigera]
MQDSILKILDHLVSRFLHTSTLFSQELCVSNSWYITVYYIFLLIRAAIPITFYMLILYHSRVLRRPMEPLLRHFRFFNRIAGSRGIGLTFRNTLGQKIPLSASQNEYFSQLDLLWQ